LDIFLITASFYFLARGEEGRWWNFAAAGLLLGLAVLDRTNLLAFVVAAVPLFLIYIKRLKWRRAAAYFAPIVLLVLAATLRNGLVAGDYVVVSSQGGINFYLGNSAEATGAYWHLASTSESNPAALNRDAATSIAEGALGRPLRPSEVQRWFFGQGSAWLRGHPGDAGRLYWRKFRMLTNDYEIGLNADFYFRRFSSFYHRAPWPWFGFVFAFGVIGLVVGWRKAAFARKAGALFVVAYALSVLLFFVSARYRMPMVPLLVAFAGAGLAYWYDLWRRRRRRSAALLTAAVLALGAFSIKGVEGARFDTGFGQAYYRLGKYYFDEGKRREAIFNLERAAATTPAFFDAYFMLGVAYEESGQAEDSLDAFRRSTLAAPNRAETHFNYGVALIRAGRSEEALAPFRRTVELDPGFAPAWVQIGEVYITLDDYVNAERAYGRAVRAQPGEPRAMGRYAEVLMKLGDYAAALRWAEAASRADPNMPGPGLTAGRIYFQYRKYAAARAYLEPEAELQPTNAEVFGLLAASCAKLGDDEAAARSYQTYTDLGGSAAPDFERDAGLPPR
jgi:Tfp pilus assembly protein PilF